MSRKAWLFILAGSALATACTAEEPVPAKATWADVEPILRANCFHCHGGIGRPSSDAAAPTAAIRYDVFDPAEVMAAVGVQFDANAAQGMITQYLGPDPSPTMPNPFGRTAMPPPPAGGLSDRDYAVIKSWAAAAVNGINPKGTKAHNHKPAISWLERGKSVYITDEDFEQVFGVLTCGSQTLNLPRSGGYPLNGMQAPCSAKLFDGWDTVEVQLAP